MINVIIGKKKTIRVSANSFSYDGFTGKDIVLKNSPTLSSQIANIEDLKDVSIMNEEDGYVLTYDNDTKKWIAAPISIDGGGF